MEIKKIWEKTKKVASTVEKTSGFLEKKAEQTKGILKDPYKILNPFAVARGILKGIDKEKKKK